MRRTKHVQNKGSRAKATGKSKAKKEAQAAFSCSRQNARLYDEMKLRIYVDMYI